MPKRNAKNDYGKATLASVTREMAKPRVPKSARKKYANLVDHTDVGKKTASS